MSDKLCQNPDRNYCGYSQETMNAMVQERTILQSRISELEGALAKLTAEHAELCVMTNIIKEHLFEVLAENRIPQAKLTATEDSLKAVVRVANAQKDTLEARISELEGALEEKIYPKCNCDKCTGSGIDALYD